MNLGEWIFFGISLEDLGWHEVSINLIHPTNAHVYNIQFELFPHSKIIISFNQDILYKNESKPTINELIDRNCKFIRYFGFMRDEDAKTLNNEFFNLLDICEKEFPNDEIDLLIQICKEIFTCYFSDNINDEKKWDEKLKHLIYSNQNVPDASTKILMSRLDPSKIENDSISDTTLNAIEKNNFDPLFNQITTLLQKGYNFLKTCNDNNRSFGRYTPIELLIWKIEDNKILFPIIEKFLQYGLDPTRRIIYGASRHSATEIALRHERQDVKEYIGILTNKINRPFDKTYINFSVSSTDKSVNTKFFRNDGFNFSTVLINVADITKYQKKLCLFSLNKIFKLSEEEY